MPAALPTAGLSSQPHQGIAARLIRRLGGALRGVVAGSIARAGGLRRPAAPQPSHNPPSPRGLPASSPRRVRAPRRPRAAAPVPPPRPARPGWLARWFGPNRHQPASRSRSPFPDDDTQFTAEAYPGLSPEACAILNTPLEECDPDLLRLLLAALARHIADSLRAELGMTDAKAVFSTLCARLGTEPGEASPDVPPAEEPPPAPATPTDEVPDASPAPPPPLLQPHGTEPADDTAIAACETTPAAASLTGPAFRRGRSLFDVSRSFRHRRRSLIDCRRSHVQRSVRDGQQRPPPRRLFYAACAGPP